MHLRFGLPVFLLSALLFLLAGCVGGPEPADETTPSPPPEPETALAAPPLPSWERREPAEGEPFELAEPLVERVDLGRLRVGMTYAEVLQIFPDPIRRELRGSNSVMWEYEVAQLFFQNGRLENWFNLP